MKMWLTKYRYCVLVIILTFAFFTRVYRLSQPSRYIFDEVYHAVTAKLMAHNDPSAYEWWNPPPEPETAVDWLHPPLAKYTQALAMDYFGENSFGWRFSSAIFGVLVVLAVYQLSEKLFKQPGLSLLAAGLASLDGLLLVQSRIAMNDIHVTFFILLTLITYLNYWSAKQHFLIAKKISPKIWLWSLTLGVCAGAAMGTKWSGFYVLVIVGLFELVHWLYLWLVKHSFEMKHVYLVLFSIVSLGVLPFVVYVMAYAQMFSLGHSLICTQQKQIDKVCYYEKITIGNQVIFTGYVSHFVELERQVWLYQTNLKATHPYQSRPWQWFLDLRPVWYHVQYADDGTIANIYAFGNPILFWAADIAIGVSLLYLIKVRRKLLIPTNLALIFTLVSYALVWMPWIRSPRIMFFYHYTPAVPFLCIILAFWLTKLFNSAQSKTFSKTVAVACVTLIALAFVIWYPQWTGIPVPQDFANKVYFAIPSWK